MQGKKSSVGLALAAAVVSLMLAGTCVASDPAYVLHSFQDDSKNGYTPEGGLILDASGNLYGTTSRGGTVGYGTVFELSPKEGGGWTETVLHDFAGPDGTAPYAGLVFDAHGNLYGTTSLGGTYGFGTVFQLSPAGGGNWTESVLHSFSNAASDGADPSSSLTFDAAGNLYGATYVGGAYGSGTVFELSPAEGGAWNTTILHSFDSNGADGTYPSSALVSDTAGNLFGTTKGGGAGTGCTDGCGIVFELTPGTDGSWKETIVHTFTAAGTQGYSPSNSGVSFDSVGNLYGTTVFGGPYGYGTAFELSPSGHAWKIKWIHGFGLGNDVGYPANGVTIDSSGNLYGTTEGSYGYGEVFELSPEDGGPWSEKVLHSLAALDVEDPSSLVLDTAGDLYGTSVYGGTGVNPQGTVFEIKP